jgi:hypothetical protein
MILQEQDALPEALLALKQAVYVDPHFVLGHFTLGNISLKQRKLNAAKGATFFFTLGEATTQTPSQTVASASGLAGVYPLGSPGQF